MSVFHYFRNLYRKLKISAIQKNLRKQILPSVFNDLFIGFSNRMRFSSTVVPKFLTVYLKMQRASCIVQFKGNL